MFKIALMNLLRHKKRAILSLIGIVIGIASIIALVSVVDGLLYDVQGALSQIQGITVIEKGAAGPLYSKIDTSYEKELEKLPYVKTVIGTALGIPRNIDGKKVEFTTSFIRLVGSDYSKKSFDTAAGIGGKLVEGKHLTAKDNGSVVIGKDLKKRLNKFVGNSIKINDKKFNIIGIYETSSKIYNSSILMTLDDFREIQGMSKDKVPAYIIELEDVSKVEIVTDIINFRFKNTLIAFSSQSHTERISGFINSLRLLVIAIAGVSAIVAGIGILNTMLMSVMERFQEIGTLKATGWTDGNVLLLILLESSILGLFGSIAGILLGIFFGKTIIEGNFGLTVMFQPYLLIGAFIFGIGISTLAGIYPAKIAASLNPVEALLAE